MKILFVCEGNINRSQMAETLCRALLPDADITSAGVYADNDGEPLTSVPNGSLEVMKEIGFDMSAQIVTQLTVAMVDAADKVILTGPVPRGPLPDYLLHSEKLETWDVPDPGYNQISFVGARDKVKERVRQFVESLSRKS